MKIAALVREYREDVERRWRICVQVPLIERSLAAEKQEAVTFNELSIFVILKENGRRRSSIWVKRLFLLSIGVKSCCLSMVHLG